MFGNFTEQARRILVQAKLEMKELRHPYVGSEHLLLAILKDDNTITKKLKQYRLDYPTLKEEIIEIVGVGSKESNWFLYTPLLKRVLENATIDAKENNAGEVTISHLFSSLLEEGEGVAIRILLGMGIDLDELYAAFSFRLSSNGKARGSEKLLLEELGIDLTEKARQGELDPVIGRDKEIKRVLEILTRRTKNNPLLIGDAGVGKTAIVEELSRMIAFGEVPLSLKNKRIISLDMATTVAGTKYRGEFEDRMRKILKEIEENDNIILFIDEIHTLVGAGGAEGAIDASNIFKPALARNKLRLIGATTTAEYKKYIEEDGALERRFQKIMVDIPSTDTVKEILYKLRPIYEKYHLVEISDAMIDLIIRLSDQYVYDRHQPDKAIDIMDEVCSKVSLKESKELKRYNCLNKELQGVRKQKNEAIVNDDFEIASQFKDQENQIMNEMNELELLLYRKDQRKQVTKEDIASVVNMKTNIPVYELLQDNITVIEKIEAALRDRILGQEEAVSSVIDLSKRIKLGYQDKNRCYSYLFCGPSGVGKTELSKIFANHLVGENNVIKLDMSEFAEAHTISKIVGAPPGYVGYMDHRNILE
ncbi:MAG: ATP-dependent Clp protease ATP-binding subunit, partial [Bacilli bacterium]|nr:ATP-dependent Clp protease ATP-binding subunit [Bacilli bacterium]